MPINSFINLDARYLFELAREGLLPSAASARLRSIAQNLEQMDAKIARHIEGDFAEGKLEADLRATSRSNILRQPRQFTNEDGETVIAALQAGLARRLPRGARAPLKPKVIEIPVGTKPSRAARKGYRLEDL